MSLSSEEKQQKLKGEREAKQGEVLKCMVLSINDESSIITGQQRNHEQMHLLIKLLALT